MARRFSQPHPIVRRRMVLGWSQVELARRAKLPRTSLGAIEGERLSPSVVTALALARTLECSVEELFGVQSESAAGVGNPAWAWEPALPVCRYWDAEVSGRRWLYPVENTPHSAIIHDGIWRDGVERPTGPSNVDSTLVVSCCDPAIQMVAAEYARVSGFRMLVFARGGATALELLQRGVVHVAGIHRSTDQHPDANAAAVREMLGSGFRLMRAARWESGIATATGSGALSVRSLVRASKTWALREPGAAARECLEDLAKGASLQGRVVRSHAAVAEAVSSGWADAGVCVRLSAEDAGLGFLSLQTETLEFCFSSANERDPRLQALIRLLRSREHRRWVSDLPGYDAKGIGETQSV